MSIEPPAGGAPRVPPPPPPPPPPPSMHSGGAVPAAAQGEKNPLLAGLASFLFAGLGQVYNGQFAKGVLILSGALLGSFLIIPGILIWLYGVYDAYRTSKQMNAGVLPFAAYNWAHIIVFIVFGFIAVALVNFFLAVISDLIIGTADYYYGEPDYCSPWDDC
jgi:TM2 domain-containing membrane protein YozV